MPRIKRQRMEINEDTLKVLLQETYNDAHQIRSTVVALFNKWNVMVNEAGEVAANGKQIIDLLELLTKNQNQKIVLMKTLNEILSKKAANEIAATATGFQKPKDGEQVTISDERKDALKAMIDQARKDGKLNIDEFDD